MAVSPVYIDTSQYVNPAVTSQDFEQSRFIMPMNDGVDHHFTDSEFRELHNFFNLWSTRGLNDAYVLDNFNRFYTIFPDMEMPADLKSYVFITRPELNLLDGSSGGASNSLAKDNANDPQLQHLFNTHPEVVYMLTSHYSGEHDLFSYLQGRTESLQLPDYQINTSDFAIPFYNYKYTYPTVTNESITSGTFDITFREDNELRITNLFHFWLYYCDAVIKNKMRPDDAHVHGNVYDFMASVYEIICDPTTERILWMDKYTGCYPVSVPISNYSHNIRSNVDSKINISFHYTKVEHNDPNIIADFNVNTQGRSGSIEPVYDTDFGIMGQSLVSCPIITLSGDTHSYCLKWVEKKKGIASTLSTNTPTLGNFARNQLANAQYREQLRRTVSTGPDTSPSTARGKNGSYLSPYLVNKSNRIDGLVDL